MSHSGSFCGKLSAGSAQAGASSVLVSRAPSRAASEATATIFSTRLVDVDSEWPWTWWSIKSPRVCVLLCAPTIFWRARAEVLEPGRQSCARSRPWQSVRVAHYHQPAPLIVGQGRSRFRATPLTMSVSSSGVSCGATESLVLGDEMTLR